MILRDFLGSQLVKDATNVFPLVRCPEPCLLRFGRRLRRTLSQDHGCPSFGYTAVSLPSFKV